ncbi:MAG TPA: o-succinylbenzoate--CoA ligase, partial [Candidatus Elarobacter sp.]|nr:o-succinylbenzoate--CoA ligase [Candidatus Elarobacter sp.]
LLAHAVLRLGATLLPLNVRLSDRELAWQIADARARVLIVEGRTVPLADRARAEHAEHAEHAVHATVSTDAEGATALGGITLEAHAETDVALRLAHDPAEVLAIIYTSGTTGQPKGAMLTVGNFWWSAIGSALNLGSHTDDRWLACMPLFHVGGLSILLRSAICGITAVVHEGFDADAVNRAIDEERVTIVSVVAVMLQRMLDARDDRPNPSSLRCVLLGGGPAPRPLLERCAKLGIPVAQTYGLTETTSQLATLAPEDALRKLGAAGRPLYGNELRVVTDDRDARVGEAGEILVRGPVVMAGYAGRPEATSRAVVDGWLHTGDVGHVDADGYLYVLDRRDDLIITGGENVYPAEVEAALLAHPWVAEAGVIGVPDAEWGQRVVAVVRLGDHENADAATTDEALRTHCRARLAGYKTPRDIRIVSEPLPRTASGKLRRAALRESAARGAAEIASSTHSP